MSVDDFHFKDFTADYYLSKDAEGISHLKVEESLTAVFPNFNQNKGICRKIPITNQAGANVTLENLTEHDLTLTRNGLPEPIWSITPSVDHFEVCTGTDDYLLSSQTYNLKYQFKKVITDFDGHQELYWDTNGTGWPQRFNQITARLHLAADLLESATGDAWCYVGRYGESGQERCNITKEEDGFTFTATTLNPYENLTFDIEFVDDTFTVPATIINYAGFGLFIVFTIICIALLTFPIKKFIKTAKKRHFYKSLFISPEFQPSKDYPLTVMAENYIGKKSDPRTAVLLDLIVRHKIELQKTDSRLHPWNVKVLDVTGLTVAESALLAILKGGSDAKSGDTIEIKPRTATRALVDKNRSFLASILKSTKAAGLVEPKYQQGTSGATLASAITISIIAIVPLLIFIAFMAACLLDDFLHLKLGLGAESFAIGRIFGASWLVPAAIAVIFVTVIVWTILSFNSRAYEFHTEAGLKASRYMDGLKLYIKMAEADRINFLQSVKGADTSPTGVVKLYEKLLPYAAVFGLEKSWLATLSEYCQVHDLEEPSFLSTGLAISDFTRATHFATNSARSSTSYSSSSSGFSGGGGGGFSGGGGGGGGGGGR